MSDRLPEFFATMAAFLRGDLGAEEVEARLGASPSGTAALEYYATLMRRNEVKILRELFPAVHAAAEARAPGTFVNWVRAYAKGRRVDHHDPNAFGFGFPEFLGTDAAEAPPWMEELADYQLCRYLVNTAPADGTDQDGFERRLFVRHYTHAVTAFTTKAIAAFDPETRPAPDAIATNALVYRELHGEAVRVYHPSVAGLVVLIHRQTGEWPAQPVLDAGQRERVTAELVARKILGA